MVCVSEPEVPESVMVDVPIAVSLAAPRAIWATVPELNLVQEGLAVTPRGTPFIVTVTGDVKPLIPVRVSTISWVAPPA